MQSFKKLVADNPDKYPSRMGQPWNDEEVVKLLTSIQSKKSIATIALEHQRTESGITSELRKLAADYHFNDKRSIEEIQKYTGLTTVEIDKEIAKRSSLMDAKEEKKKAKKEEKEKPTVVVNTPEGSDMREVISLLKDIQSKLGALLEKVA